LAGSQAPIPLLEPSNILLLTTSLCSASVSQPANLYLKLSPRHLVVTWAIFPGCPSVGGFSDAQALRSQTFPRIGWCRPHKDDQRFSALNLINEQMVAKTGLVGSQKPGAIRGCWCGPL